MSDDQSTSRAEQIFAGQLSSLEEGGELDVEALCAAHPDVADELRPLVTQWLELRRVAASDPGGAGGGQSEPRSGSGGNVGTVVAVQADESGEFTSEVMQRLARRQGAFGRYRREAEIARGGQGSVLRVWDEDLRRNLAMKVILDGSEKTSEGAPRVKPRTLGRFLEEAQVTGQLDHPGIVPVHELGLDSDGRVYFTMKLVEGRNFRKVIELVHEGREGWTLTRALGVLLKVCEAMTYAHAKSVIHRDLKPANIMVGPYGEVYVMDWGLAKVLGEEDTKDIRIRSEDARRAERVRSDRGERGHTGAHPPLMTMDGDVVGTPAYMSPEQAAGELDTVGARSDIYSVGAMLYHLLVGHAPYDDLRPPDNYAVWRHVCKRPPTRLQEACRGVAPELEAICERAMSRDPARRYSSMAELADELRAFLESRVVHSYKTGALVELRKWVARNRATAAVAAVLIAVLVASGAVFGLLRQRHTHELLEVSDERAVAGYLTELTELGPIHPQAVPAMEELIRGAEQLASRAPVYRRQLAELRARASSTVPLPEPDLPPAGQENLPFLRQSRADRAAWIEEQYELDESGSATEKQRLLAIEMLSILPTEVDFLDARIRLAEARQGERVRHRFESEELARRHEGLEQLVRGLDELVRPEVGALAVARKRLELARSLRQVSLGDHAEEWGSAIASIRDECPAYEGLEITPQLGLVPLHRNAAGLWEFWHVLSGAPPEPEGDHWRVTGETGIVLVLIPGGDFVMGASRVADGLRYDEQAWEPEGPPHEVSLAPFFLSKYEMTQGQWVRATGSNPSQQFAGRYPNVPISRSHPVEHVTWRDSFRVLERWNLTLPTEAQWEYAARAGTPTRYWTGDTAASLAGAANFLGSSDPYITHAPVDSMRANPFGLHHVLGNVQEWCLDWNAPSYHHASEDGAVVQHAPGDGRIETLFEVEKTARGGGFMNDPSFLRVTSRLVYKSDHADDKLGVRPARPLHP